ncbi:MAG: YraN family protein [Oligoflexia bacterium]|nr:YraN family protein [Oligoflexia bacterium]
MFSTRQIGTQNELKVQSYLEKSGWRVIAKNLRTPFAEIDLLVQKHEKIRIIEVKTRKIDDPTRPPIGRLQFERLKWAAKWVRSRFPGKCYSARLVMVTSRGMIERNLPLHYDDC